MNTRPELGGYELHQHVHHQSQSPPPPLGQPSPVATPSNRHTAPSYFSQLPPCSRHQFRPLVTPAEDLKIYQPTVDDTEAAAAPSTSPATTTAGIARSDTHTDKPTETDDNPVDPELQSAIDLFLDSRFVTPVVPPGARLAMRQLGAIWWSLFDAQQRGELDVDANGDVGRWNELCNEALGRRWGEHDRNWWIMMRLER